MTFTNHVSASGLFDQKRTSDSPQRFSRNHLSFFLSLCACTLIIGVQGLTQIEESSIRLSLSDWLETNEGPQTGDTAAAIVRLVFHDAGTHDRRSRSGGARACIMASLCDDEDQCEFAAAENNGLQFVVRGLLGLYFELELVDVLSKADFLHLAGVVALESVGGPRVPYRWGRQDCNVSPPRFPGALPDAHWDADKVFPHFESRYGFSREETMLLLAAHSIGRMENQNSGFVGDWDLTRARFDNGYFLEIVDLSSIWVREKTPSGNDIWGIRGASGAEANIKMLNADIGLYWRICGDNPEECGHCQITHAAGGCSVFTSEFQFAQSMAINEGEFRRRFTVVFQKLQELGHTSLQPSLLSGQTTVLPFSSTSSTTTTTEPVVVAQVQRVSSSSLSRLFGAIQNQEESSSTSDTNLETLTTSSPAPQDTSERTITTTQSPSTTTPASTTEHLSSTTQSPSTTTPVSTTEHLSSTTQSTEAPSVTTQVSSTTAQASVTEQSPSTTGVDTNIATGVVSSLECKEGLLQTDMNQNGILDCAEIGDAAPCNPNPCGMGSVYCDNPPRCNRPMDFVTCEKDARITCPSPFHTCMDGTCQLDPLKCESKGGIRWPGNTCT